APSSSGSPCRYLLKTPKAAKSPGSCDSSRMFPACSRFYPRCRLLLAGRLCSRADRPEVVALRHQLNVLRRQRPGRPWLSCADRLGVLGLGIGTEGRRRWLRICSSAIVLAAAPVNSTVTTPLNVQWSKAKLPPPYFNSRALNSKFLQAIPSSCCIEAGPPETFESSMIPWGTTGILLSVWTKV